MVKYTKLANFIFKGSGCQTDADCPVARPHCSPLDGLCFECLDNSHCSGATPVCNLDNHECEAGDNTSYFFSLHICSSSQLAASVLPVKSVMRIMLVLNVLMTPTVKILTTRTVM